MSRIGKKPVAIPSGVTANVTGKTISIKGPKGTLQVDPANDTKRARALWGTTRALLANVVDGVTKGFERRLEITGVGYRASVQGKNLQLLLGYSHEVSYPIPEGIAIATPKPTEIVVTGIDKQKVGQVAAEIRDYRPPEPYKGKGVKYAGEYIFRKEGKKK
jgi:large subunit ribosomal protein L6